MSAAHRSTTAKFLRYICTGGSAAVVDICVFWSLHHLGLSVTEATLCSFAVSLVANYLLTSHFAFGVKPSWKGLAMFASGAALGFCINKGITIGAAGPLGLPPVLAKVMGIGVAFIANFAINLLVVFRRHPAAEPVSPR